MNNGEKDDYMLADSVGDYESFRTFVRLLAEQILQPETDYGHHETPDFLDSCASFARFPQWIEEFKPSLSIRNPSWQVLAYFLEIGATRD